MRHSFLFQHASEILQLYNALFQHSLHLFLESTVPKKKTLKMLIKTHRKVLKTSNLAYTMLLVLGQIYQKIRLSVCPMAVLGSQGIVVKCTAAMVGGL